MIKKKIFIISPYNPFVATLGAAPKALNYRLRKLCEIAQVTLLTFSQSHANEINAAKAFNIETIFIDMPEKKISNTFRIIKFLNILLGKLFIFEDFNKMVNALVPYTIKIISEKDIDLIHIEDIVIAPIINYLPSKIPNIIFFHNLLSLQYKNLFRTKKSIGDRLISYIEYLWIKRFEKKMIRLYKHAVVLTSIEKEHALSLNKKIEIVEIPLAIDIDEYTPNNSSLESPSLVFSGTMSYLPNQEAVFYFMKYIFPNILSTYPKIKFYIVGQNPCEEIKNLANDNVIVTGKVESICDYIVKCNVVVVPLLNGGGMRFKIIEAFALEKAIVSTPIGAQGIDYTNGKDILIASNANSFAEKVCSLLGDPSKSQKLGEKARKLVEEKYCLNVVWEKWERFYKQSIGKI